jgi:hypothetical protein
VTLLETKVGFQEKKGKLSLDQMVGVGGWRRVGPQLELVLLVRADATGYSLQSQFHDQLLYEVEWN